MGRHVTGNSFEMGSRTLSRYLASRFFVSVVAVFAGVFVLVLFVDYIDLMRRASDAPKAQASMLVLVSLFRVPQIMERVFPFSMLVGAMTCFLSLSRRMELVVARGAGISAWQIIAPALLVALALGAFGSLVYNPVSANLRELSKRIESQIFGQFHSVMDYYDSGYWSCLPARQ
jgi:lipopolysaccharide export system permease protein